MTVAPAPGGGDDHVPVDSLGDVGGLVAYGVADVLDRDAVVAHDRDHSVTSLVGVLVMDACSLDHLAEAPVERLLGVWVAVFTAEHEVGVVPRGASG